MSNRAAQEIAIARREATQAIGRNPGPVEVPISSTLLQRLVGRWRLTEALRNAAAKAATRTGLEPVEAAKLSECHELLAEVVS